VPALAEVAAIVPVGSAHFLRRPRVVDRIAVGEGLVLVRLAAEVPPSMEWLVEDFLSSALASRLEDVLASDPLVYTLDEEAVRRYERTVSV
jgi:hypothetical protein